MLASAPASLAEIRIVTTAAAFHALAEPWTALLDRMGQAGEPFQTHGWLSTWMDVYLKSSDSEGFGTLQVVTAWRHGRLVMAWPLVRNRHAGLSILSWMGAPVSQYGDALIEPGVDTDALLLQGWNAVKTLRADLVDLRRVRADASVAPLLAMIGARPSTMLAAPCCDFGGPTTFAAFEQRYRAKARSNRRRQMRRLKEQGPVTIGTFGPGPDAHALVQSAIALKRHWLRASGRAGPAVDDARFAEFFSALATTPASPTAPRLMVTALHCGGSLAAVTVAVGHGTRLLCHIVAHDPRFGKAGAGNLVIERSLAAALVSGAQTFDFLSPADDYKLEWANRTVAVADWTIPLSALGAAYGRVYLEAMRPNLKRIANAIAAARAAFRQSASMPAASALASSAATVSPPKLSPGAMSSNGASTNARAPM